MVHLSLFIATKRNVLKGNAKKKYKKKIKPFQGKYFVKQPQETK